MSRASSVKSVPMTPPPVFFLRPFASNERPTNGGGGGGTRTLGQTGSVYVVQNWWAPCLLSFAAGATSIGLLWWSQQRHRLRRPRHLGRDNGNEIGDGSEFSEEDVFKSVSWIDPRNWNRIGELPRMTRRSHWPWETIRKRPKNGKNSPDVNFDGGRDESDEGSTPSYSDHDAHNDTRESFRLSPPSKKGLCIGRIFGLDVGGTLTKLVYFEPKSSDDDPTTPQPMFRRRNSDAEQGRRRTLSLVSSRKAEEIKSALEQSEEKSVDDPALRRHESAPIDLFDLVDTKLGEDRSGAGSQSQIHRSSSDPEDHDPVSYCPHDHTPDLASSPPNSMKRSSSMFDFSQSHDRAQALHHFYNFARNLDMQKGEGGDRIHVDKDHPLSFYSRELGGDFHFLRFESRRMQNAIHVIRDQKFHENIIEIGATGGGAHKYADDFDRYLGIRMDRQDELDSLVAGMQFVLSTVVGECYTFRPHEKMKGGSFDNNDADGGSQSVPENDTHAENPSKDVNIEDNGTKGNDNSADRASESEKLEQDSTPNDNKGKGIDKWWWSRKVQRDAVTYSSTYPYLLVTIGTGVSILRVDGPRKHERISGSTIGGGTYWGLIRLLTDVEDFEDVMRLAEHGDPAKVDMMVGDIYGKNSSALEKIGLTSDVVASSFGKLVSLEDPAKGLKQEDLARALLLMVTNNIGQVAYLNAKLHKTPRIYFIGNFLRGNRISQRRLSYAISFWSKGEMEALFLEHEGYFGALGAFLLSQNISHGDYGFFKWNHDNDNNTRQESQAVEK